MVDIGDQKTSVSCVEDGISHPETRLLLPYGGADITQVFLHLLRKVGFPHKECDLEGSLSDLEALSKMKEEVCHLDLDRCGITQTTLDVKASGTDWYVKNTKLFLSPTNNSQENGLVSVLEMMLSSPHPHCSTLISFKLCLDPKLSRQWARTLVIAKTLMIKSIWQRPAGNIQRLVKNVHQ